MEETGALGTNHGPYDFVRHRVGGRAVAAQSLAELRTLTDAWLWIYNGKRPNDSLGRVPPLTFLPRPTTARQSTYAVST